jgi:hypothetical protein
MMRSPILFVLILGLFCLFAGCSVDRCQIVSHPSAAKPGDTIPVLLSDVYLVISTTPALTQLYTRDSLHVGYGLPAGWSILSSDYYVATTLKLGQIAAGMSDPTVITNLIQDSLAVFTARKSPMTKDNGWSAYFTGKTFSAHNTASDDSIQVKANNVGQWAAYSGRINLSVPAGTKMDTGLALASLPIDSATLKTIKSFYNTDSIWIKAIPVVCFSQIIVGQAEGIDTLLYFTKTGPKPSTAVTLIPNYDKGDMSYVPITINKQNAVLWRLADIAGRSLLRLSSPTLTIGSTLTMSVGAAGPWRLSICDPAGRTVRLFSTAGGSQASNRIVWDGTSSTGSLLTAGTYCVKLDCKAAQGKTVSQTVRIVK